MGAVGVRALQPEVQPVLGGRKGSGNFDADLAQPRSADGNEKCGHGFPADSQVGKTLLDQIAPRQPFELFETSHHCSIAIGLD